MSDIKSIVFVVPYIFERVESLAESLYLVSGIKPHVITFRTEDETLVSGNYSSVQVGSIETLVRQIKSLAPHIVHNITKYFDMTTVTLLKSNIQFHYDYKDIFIDQLLITNEEVELHRHILRAMLQRGIPFSYRDGRYNVVAKSLGFLHPTGYFLPEFITKHQYDSLLNVLQPNTSADRRSDIVFIGNFSLETLNPEQAGVGQIAIVRCLIEQGLKYTVYPKQTSGRTMEDFREYIELANTNETFDYASTLSRTDLHLALPNYGWGSFLQPYNHFPNLANKIFFKTPSLGLPGRAADYIGSGLPILVSGVNNPELNDWVDLYGIGLNITGAEIYCLNQLIKTVDYVKLRRNVTEFATKLLSPYKQGSNLVSAYEKFQ